MSNTYCKEGSKITFSFSYNKNIVDAIKELDYKDRTYDPLGKEWIVTMSVVNQPLISRIIKDFNFSPIDKESKDSNDESAINSYIESKSRKNLIKSFKSESDRISGVIKPRLFQYDGIDIMCSWNRGINGDDMGLGKTVQTIFSTEIMNRFPCLLICPSSVKYQWKELWNIINPERKISIIESSDKNKNWDADVVIINYDIIGKTEKKQIKEEEVKVIKSKYSELTSIKWDFVVFDEIHFLKNYKSRRAEAAKIIVKNIKNRYGLTGTLIESKPIELANPLMIIGMFNEVFGSWNNFVNRYCDFKVKEVYIRGEKKVINDFSGASNTIELNKLLRETCYFRREKRDVLDDLPPIQSSILNIDLSNKREYQKAEDDFIDYLMVNYTDKEVRSAMMAEILVQRNYLRQLSLKGKIKGIIEWLDDYAEQTNEKVLVVGNFTEPMELLSIHFDTDLINGDMNAFEKREAIKKWNKNNKQFLFGNISAIGTGTDGLQENCNTLVVVDLPEKPSVLDQTVSRIERIGVKNAINVYYLLNKDTIDMRLWEAIEIKRMVTEAVNKGKKFVAVDIDKLLLESYLR